MNERFHICTAMCGWSADLVPSACCMCLIWSSTPFSPSRLLLLSVQQQKEKE